MHSLMPASRPRLPETDPKWFVFETSCYPFGGRIRRFAKLNVNRVNIFLLYFINLLFLSMHTFIILTIFVGLKGRVLYTAKKVTQLKFHFDDAQLGGVTSDDVMLADLRLYQKIQRRQRRRQRGRWRRHRVVTVRVSIHQIISNNRRFPRAKLLDSR